MTAAYWEIPRIWHGATVVILGGGPSLSPAQFGLVADWRAAGRGRVIAINNAYRVAPWADLLYFCDEGRFWAWNYERADFRNFAGLKVALDGQGVRQEYGRDPSLRRLRNYGHLPGFARAPSGEFLRDGLHTGRSSGYQALCLAALMGAARIVLLGYDMKVGRDGRTHWHDDYPFKDPPSTYASQMLPHFASLVEPLRELEIGIINASPDSDLDCFPHVALTRALELEAVPA